MADLVITKCGASTLMEILLLKKIPLINSYLWEQEKGNLDYVVKNKLGFYIKNSSLVAENISNLIADAKITLDLESNVISKGLRNGLEDVAAFIHQTSFCS
ncbi:MAG: glycosyl transferase family protein [Ignavibacteria bacterium]|nr:MAG: glycosyl transferase family protein [Ignavibacteria bacterium]KAF0158104.1 MAG: glycosyl transferase family protein [Ignavibacteria bacterium]